MKCTWPTPVFCNLYSTDWRRGLASGKTQILALGNAKIYQHVGISKAKFLRRGQCLTPTPDARYFASQWNIGYNGSETWTAIVQYYYVNFILDAIPMQYTPNTILNMCVSMGVCLYICGCV